MRIEKRRHLRIVHIRATANRGLTGLLRAFKARREHVQADVQDVDSRVSLAVHHVATLALHQPLVERHTLQLAALTAHPRTGREAVDHDHRHAVQLGFVIDERPQSAESGIVHGVGEAVVFSPCPSRSSPRCRPSCNRGSSGPTSRAAMPATVGYALVQLGEQQPRLRPGVAAFLFPTQPTLTPLEPPEPPEVGLELLVGGKPSSTRQRGQPLDAEIDADRFARRRVRVVVVSIHQARKRRTCRLAG